MAPVREQTRYISQNSGLTRSSLSCARGIHHGIQDYVQEQGHKYNCQACLSYTADSGTFIRWTREITENKAWVEWNFSFQVHPDFMATPGHTGTYQVNETSPKILISPGYSMVLGEGWTDNLDDYVQNDL